MPRLICTPSRRRLVTLVMALAATRAVAQQPTGQAAPPSRADCAKMLDLPDHGTMDHAAHHAMLTACGAQQPAAGVKVPSQPGQAAFGAISEIVRMLENDPATDWSKVNVEALRQHLIDMDEVTLHSRVVQRDVPGGLEAEVTGTGATAAAIRRMVSTHASMVAGSPEFDSRVQLIPSGVRLTVAARAPGDSAVVAHLRGLGFIGFLTEGDHHARHHLAIARGDAAPHQH